MSNPKAVLLQRGVIVEFDFTVLNGHALLLEACQERLGREGVKLDAGLMARSMGGKSFSAGLNALCNRQQKMIDVPSVVPECNAAFAEKLTAVLPKVPESFKAFVKAAVAKNVKVVVGTRLEAEAVLPVLGDDIPEELLVIHHDIPNGFGFSTWEGWRRAARKGDLHDRMCVAVAGSGFSMKGALNAGMCVVIKPNPLTEYQDFSGSDEVITDFSPALADDVIRMLRV